MAENNPKNASSAKKSEIKTEIKEKRTQTSSANRSSGKARSSSSSSTGGKQRSAKNAQRRPDFKHSYSNYEREGDITVEIPQSLLSDIKKEKREKKETARPQQKSPLSAQRAPRPKQEKAEDVHKKHKKAARTVADLNRSSPSFSPEKTNVFSRVTVAVSATNDKRLVKNSLTVREKLYKTKKKNIERKEKLLKWRRSTAVGRFFLDDGQRYDAHTVEDSQKLTSTEKLAHRLSNFLYSNIFARKFAVVSNAMRSYEARAYGITLITFGLLSLLSFFLSAYMPLPHDADWVTLGTGIVAIAFSIPLILSRAPIQQVFEKSFIINTLFFDFFGLRRSGNDKAKPAKITYSLTCGLLLGSLSFFVSPATVVGILFLAWLCVLVFSTPEFGLSLLVFLLPFLTMLDHPTVIVCAIIILSYVSYARKLAMGKRSFSFRPADLFVLLFSMFYLGGGIFSFATDGASHESALVYFCMISVYFLASNLLTSKRTLDTMVRVLLASGFIIALLGIFQQFSGDITADWLDVQAYDYIRGRIDTAFENSNVLASYLVLTTPFALVYLFDREKKITMKVFSVFVLAAFICALVFTWSRGAWLGLFVSLLMLVTFVFRRSPKLIVALFTCVPSALLFAPDSVWNRIISIFSFFGENADTSISYRLAIWRDSLRMFFDNALGGIGTGNDTFREAFIRYNPEIGVHAEHSHNLFLQIGINVGMFALILFVLVLVYTYKGCYSMEFTANQSPVRPICLAAFCSATALLVNGMTDYVWYNYRICFLFWFILGICNATYRIATAEQRYTDFMRARISSFAAVDVPYKE